jgi:hypothetical protein
MKGRHAIGQRLSEELRKAQAEYHVSAKSFDYIVEERAFGICRERVEPTSRTKREAREKLLAAARRREIDVVLVWRA